MRDNAFLKSYLKISAKIVGMKDEHNLSVNVPRRSGESHKKD
jgi:hypothetical protein